MRFIILGLVLVAAVLYRMPYWVNSASLNSDHAVVGLQARAILNGEWSWYLWGVGYQASLEPLLTAFAFKTFGDSPQSLAMVGIAGFLIVVASIYWTLSEYLTPIRSGILSLFAAFTVGPITQITVFPPRIWAIATLFISFPLFISKRTPLTFMAGLLAFLSLYVDYYTIQLLPAALWFGYRQGEGNWSRRKPYLFGCLAGMTLLGLARFLRPEGGVPLSFSPKTFLHNIPLLIDTVLPVLGGFSSHFFGQGHLPFHWLEVAQWSAGIMGFLLFLSAVLSPVKREVRTLTIAGALGSLTSIIGFLGSSMASDVHSVRFLAVIVWLAPFTLAALAFSLKRTAFAALLFPLLFTSSIFGWNSLIPHVQDMRITKTPSGQATEEYELISLLRQRGIKYAQAQFWTAYRLSFLSGENPVVVPDAEHENRYRPYWESYQKTVERAAIFRIGDTQSSSEFHRNYLISNHFTFTELRSGDYLIFLWNRDQSPTVASNR